MSRFLAFRSQNFTLFSFAEPFVEISPAEGVAHPFEMKPERLARAIFTSALHTKNSVKESNSLKCLLKKAFLLCH